MGRKEFDQKLEAAVTKGGYDNYLSLLQIIRKEKIREPRLVAKYGTILLQKNKWRLGDELWNIYEQVFIASIDLHDDDLAAMCLGALQNKFPDSSRVGRLEGMLLEQKGMYTQAQEVYDEILKKNPANMLILKRKIAILKAQRKTQDAIAALNELLKNFQTDQGAWIELAELHLSIGTYRYAAFCYEELVLLNPMDALYHSRLAGIYATLGGLENLRLARKHYAHSIDLNKTQNIRAYLGLIMVTKAIAGKATSKADAEDAELNLRLLKWASSHVESAYASNAKTEISDAVHATLSAFNPTTAP